ncbi:MAG: polysaccharide pyruvyl transferase family protein [Planctomycetota bacterium]
MRIVLYGTDSTANLGDQAILIAMMDALRGVFEGASFTILTAHPELAVERVGRRPGVERIGALPRIPWGKKTTMRLVSGYAASRALIRLGWGEGGNRQVARWIAESDLLALVGGRYLASPYFSTLLVMLWGLAEARRAGVPAVGYSQSVGPFATIKEKIAAQLALRRLELMVARDRTSFEFLKHFAVPGLRVEQAPDCVFGLRPAEAGQIEEAMRREGIDEGRRPLVAITGRTLTATIERYDARAKRGYLEMLAGVSDALLADGAQVVFLSSTYRAGSYDRHDPDVAKEFRALMRRPEGLKVVETEYPVEVLKGLYGRMNLVISTRMHPTILASAMGVPVVALAYEYKGVGVLELLGLTQYALRIPEATTERVLTLAREALAQEQAIRAHLRERIAELQEQALSAARHVREAYEAYHARGR